VICHDGGMDIQMLTSSPCNVRGDGQVSHLLLAEGQFGAQRLCITCVECQPGSQQALHRHRTQEQVYVIVRGQGQMLVGGEERAVGEGTMVFIPPGAEHAIRNTSAGLLAYVSATAPPFTATVSGQTWEPQGLTTR
jgi:mannose-6-phosphate isomerase-like protein (cupin superfamily)